jgi:TPR repeat protein
MRISSSIRIGLIAAAIAVAPPAFAFDPTPELNRPADVFAFGYRAYQDGDYETALDALGYAADNGYTIAQWLLGWMYEQGKGVGRDDRRAFEFFAGIVVNRADARLDAPDTPFVADAFVAVGDYYRAGGQAVGAVDFDAAFEMYRHAAVNFDDAEAQYNVAIMLYRGEVGGGDPAEAVRWARIAADAGNANAQALLGYLLFLGEGIQRQPVLGLAYLNFARARTAGGDPDIQRMHEEVMALATESERRTALELANGWLSAMADAAEPAEDALANEPASAPADLADGR